MSLLLTPGSFFGLEAGQAQALEACGVQPNNWPGDQGNSRECRDVGKYRTGVETCGGGPLTRRAPELQG